MDTVDVEEDSWRPPREAEMKVIHARRERSDKISKLMGEYMLKGYRMLGSTCEECGTILLQDRQKKTYCVACNELDTEHAKDDPALSEEAAHSQVQEGECSAASFSNVVPQRDTLLLEQAPPSSPGQVSPRFLQPSSEFSRNMVVPQKSVPTSSMESEFRIEMPSVTTAPAEVVLNSLGIVTRKLSWATRELEKTSSVEFSIQLCELIRACSTALQSLQGVSINASLGNR